MLPEADLPFEVLQDPPGIAFWPEYKGRDGCRTPMPWQSDLVHGGFSGRNPMVNPWLPVVSEHRLRAWDVNEKDAQAPLHFMRSFLGWRKARPVLVRGSVQYLDGDANTLVLIRQPEKIEDGQAMLCAFNFTAVSRVVELASPVKAMSVAPAGLPTDQQGVLHGTQLNLPPYGIYFAEITG